jgi:flavin reductase (DIM6/NTAB) family NADH-FMN oxidoreductase RutF
VTATLAPAHVVTDPAILYVGTPVVLLSSLNPDGSANLAPISSAFWLGDRCVLGLARTSHTWANLARTGEVVLALPSAREVDAVDRLALLTGADPVPPHKVGRGYRHERDKFGTAGLAPVPSELVAPPRVAECPIAMEVSVTSMTTDPDRPPTVEGRVLRVHAHPDVLVDGHPNRIDPDRWRPLIMSFQHFHGLTDRLRPSRLASIAEELYRD